jgi:hypothetical protein
MAVASEVRELAALYPAVGSLLSECALAAGLAWSVGCGYERILAAFGPVGAAGLVPGGWAVAADRARLAVPRGADLDLQRAAAMRAVESAALYTRRGLASVLGIDVVEAARGTRPVWLPFADADREAVGVVADVLTAAVGGRCATIPYARRLPFDRAVADVRRPTLVPPSVGAVLRDVQRRTGRALAINGFPLAAIGPLLGWNAHWGYGFRDWARLAPPTGPEMSPEAMTAIQRWLELVEMTEQSSRAARVCVGDLRSKMRTIPA